MRRLLSLLVPFVAALLVTPLAFAAWSTNGAGVGAATATSLNPGNSPQADRGNGTVLLTWDAATLGSGAPVGSYDVIRDGDASAPVCSQVAATNCTDENPLPGRVSYAVIPRIGANWVGPASEATSFQYDIFPPSTTLMTRTPDPNSAGWNKDDVIITLEATDPEPVASGVKAIHYVLDGVATVVPGATATITVAEEKVSSLKYWAVDNLDNTEGQTPTDDVKIDKTAPITGFSVSPTPNTLGWNNADVTVTLTPSDAGSGVLSTEYSLTAGATWTPYPDGGISVTTEGTHPILYRSTDMAGNVETAKTATVKLDKTAPVSSASLAGSNVTLSATDDTSQVAAILYKIGSAPSYTTYTGPFAVTSGQTVAFHAVDKAGNVESPDKTFTNTPSDTTGPTISFVDLVSGAIYANNSGSQNPWSSVCSVGQICATISDSSGVDAASVKYTLEATSGTNGGKCWGGSGFVAKTAGLCPEVSMTLSGGRFAGGAISNGNMKAGNYTVVIKAKDSSSSANLSSLSRNFTIS